MRPIIVLESRRRVVGLLITLLMLLAAVGCSAPGSGAASPGSGTTATSSGQATSGGTGSQPADSAEIVIAYLGGVTGDYAPWTEAQYKAALVAVNEFNKVDGGPLGRQVKLILEDNQSTVEGGIQAARKTVLSSRAVAINGIESDPLLAILDFVKENKIPVIAPAAGTTQLDKNTNPYVFRVAPSDSFNGKIAAQIAIENGWKKIAVMYENTEGTLSPARVFMDTIPTLGGTIVAEVGFNSRQNTYQAELAKAFAGKPDVVYLAAGYESGPTILREWQRRGYGGRWLVTTDLVQQGTVDAVGAELMKDVVGQSPIENMESEAFKRFAKMFEAEVGTPPQPGMYQANTYDAQILLTLAIVAAGTVDGEQVAKQIPRVTNPPGEECYEYARCVELLKAGKDINYQGASGPIDFDQHGNILTAPFAEMMVKDGLWQQGRLVGGSQ